MTERKLLTQLNKRLKTNCRESCAIEAKIGVASIPFNALQEHQENALIRVHRSTLVHKISDVGFGIKPFDVVVLRRAGAYVAAMYYKPREYKVAYLISIVDWIMERTRSKRKSLTIKKAKEIGVEIKL
jgi:hypothetical protein